MASNDREIKLKVSATTDGVDGIKELSKTIKEVAKSGGDAAPEFQKLVDELDKLAEQQGLIDQFKDVSAAVTATEQKLSEIKTRTDAHAQAVTQQREALQLLKAALDESNSKVNASKGAVDNATVAWREAKAAQAAARAEVEAGGRATKDQMAAQKEAAAAVRETKAALDQAKAALAADTAERTRNKQAYSESNTAYKDAADGLSKLESQLKQADGEFSKLSATSGKLTTGLTKLGVDLNNVAEAEVRIAQQSANVVNGFNQLAASTNAASSRLSAFGTVGVRSVADIHAEMNAVRAAMDKLRTDSQTTGNDMARAMSAAEAKMVKLKQELQGVDAETKKLGENAGQSSIALEGMAQAMAAAFTVDKFVEANVAMDSARRTLDALYGSSKAGGEQLDYVKNVAARLGLEVSATATQYAGLIAATKDSKISQEQARATFEATAGAMSRLGKSSADVEGALLALQQMASKGTVSMEELRQQLGDRLPGVLPALSKELGLVEGELEKLVAAGQLTARDVFPALESALKKTFKTDGQIESLQASINRLKNDFTELFTAVGETGVIEVALDAIKIFAIGALTSFNELKAAADFLGVAVGRVVGDFGALIELDWKKAAANTRLYREEVARIGEEHDKGIDRVAKIVASLEMNKQATKGATQATQENVTANEKVNESYIKVGKQIADLKDKYDDKVATQNKLIKSTQEEVTASNKLAEAFGNETEKSRVAAENAVKMQGVIRDTLTLRQNELTASQSAMKALEEYIARTGDNTKAIDENKKKLQERIDVSTQEIATLKAQSAERDAEVAKLQAHSQALQDNSARMGELKVAYQESIDKVRELRAAVADGTATQNELNAAEIESGRVKALYNDALKDQIEKVNASRDAKIAELNVAESGIRVQIEQQRSVYELAKARGQEGVAIRAMNEIKELEIKLAKMNAEVKKAEAEASKLAAQAEIEQLRASEVMTDAIRAKIRALEASVKAKEAEAKIAGITAERLDDLYWATRNAADAAAQGASSYDGLSNSLDNVASSADRAGRSMKKMRESSAGGADAGGGGGGGGGDSNWTSVGAIDFRTLMYKKGADAATVEKGAAIASGKFNELFYQTMPSMFGGTTDYMMWLNGVIQRATELGMQEAQGQIMADAKAKNPPADNSLFQPLQQLPGFTLPTPPSPAGQGAQQAPRSTTVNINLGGRSTAVNVASQQDANALTALLKQLEQEAGRAY